ncbi:NAD(P)H-dependent glycerol-3-phosphate dehydrogenase [Lentisphaerota bacterium WC36G]|nr:NAD(P)-dependent glycerol-3-phosphate dehydrogenase [Lentisphaerae bacterium WC36]
MQITVISDGAWGTALALTLLQNSHTVTLWGPFEDYINEMQKSRVNSRFLPSVKLPNELKLTANMTEAIANSEMIVLATPSQYLRQTLEQLKPCYNEQLIVNVAKGIEKDSLMRMSEICHEILGDNIPYCVLSGPSHAEETAKKLPTVVTIAAKNEQDAKIAQEAFMTDYFRVYTHSDIIGLELGGAFKNVMAIAAGIADGMELGDNPKAALITRAIVEMSRLGVALGGKEKTFSGLGGVGDLIVTCNSTHSRNRHVGEELGRGKSLDEILNDMGMVVAEGVVTTKSAYDLARKYDVKTPIIDEVYNILYADKSPQKALMELMTRSPKNEWE